MAITLRAGAYTHLLQVLDVSKVEGQARLSHEILVESLQEQICLLYTSGAKRRCRSDLGVEEQVHFAHQLFVQADRNVDCSFEAGPGTKQLPAHRIRLKRYDAQARFGDDCPAMADAFVDALLGIHEGLGHALSRQHQVVLIVLIRPANRNACLLYTSRCV